MLPNRFGGEVHVTWDASPARPGKTVAVVLPRRGRTTAAICPGGGTVRGSALEAEALGQQLAEELLTRGARGFLARPSRHRLPGRTLSVAADDSIRRNCPLKSDPRQL